MCASSRAAIPIGVRGIKLGKDDRVISMAILRHVDATPAERAAYLKRAPPVRRERRPTRKRRIDLDGEDEAETAS